MTAKAEKGLSDSSKRSLKKSTTRLNRKRQAADAAWELHQDLIRDVYEEDSGATFAAIADIIGVTKARVYQIVTGKRSSQKKVDVEEEITTEAEDLVTEVPVSV